MIETRTNWEDSGFDCEHCGGEILLRTDHETGLPDRKCYQCRACSCQWSLDGELERVGSGEYCRAAARRRQETASFDVGDVIDWTNRLSKSLWILLAIIAGALLLRFGGGVVLRLVLPLLLAGVSVYLVVRYGRREGWW